MLLASALRPRADVTWSPLDSRWYTPYLGLDTDAGVAVGPETIFRCGVVLAAVRFKADSVAICTPQLVQRLPDGTRRPAPDHPVQALLRNPNAWQTGFEWTRLMVLWLATWGKATCRVMPSRTYFAGELRPIHPSRIRVIDQAADGTLVYEHTPANGQKERLAQDEVHQYNDLSLDGLEGMVTYLLIRNIVGVALAAEKHSATFLRKGTRLSGILSTEQDVNDVAMKQIRESWQTSHGGNENVGGVAVLKKGFKFMPTAVDFQKAQFVELTDSMVGRILMALGVPGVVVGWMGDKTATYASADAFFEKGGLKHCVLPIIMNMEQRDQKGLLVDAGGYAIKRNMAVLERANTKDRYAALYQSTGRPWQTGNEARAIEDLNPDPDPSMDKVVLPVNMGTGGLSPDPAPTEPTPAQPKRKPAPQAPPEDSRFDPRIGAADAAEEARLVARAERAVQQTMVAARQAVRREVSRLKGERGHLGLAVRYAKDPGKWSEAVRSFYQDDHQKYLLGSPLLIDADAAADYVREQTEAVLTHGMSVVETWEETAVPRLAALALGEDAA
jgi:HK97 family phage portal protein